MVPCVVGGRFEETKCLHTSLYMGAVRHVGWTCHGGTTIDSTMVIAMTTTTQGRPREGLRHSEAVNDVEVAQLRRGTAMEAVKSSMISPIQRHPLTLSGQATQDGLR